MKIRDIIAKSELDYYKQTINFTREEEIVFDMLSKKKSIKEIADKLNTSETTVSRRIKSVKDKIGEVIGVSNRKYEIPVWKKVTLTKEEAAEYSNIGINRIEELMRDPKCSFVIYIGRKKLIKRKEFEQYISDTIEI